MAEGVAWGPDLLDPLVFHRRALRLCGGTPASGRGVATGDSVIRAWRTKTGRPRTKALSSGGVNSARARLPGCLHPTRPSAGGALLLGATVLTLPLLTGAGSLHVGAASVRCAFREVPGPRIIGSLNGVTVRTRDDVWAVGGRQDSHSRARAFIEHWDGRKLRRSTSPKLTAGQSALMDVTALSPDSAWAVGFDRSSALIEHWNGTHWRTIASPYTGRAALYGVAARTAHDVWAVGTRETGDRVDAGKVAAPLVLHWDGRRWRVHVPPHLDAVVYALSAARKAVFVSDSSRVASWEGGRWSLLPSAAVGEAGAIAARSRRDLWVTGGEHVIHWDGRRWRVTLSARSGTTYTSVATGAHEDIWTVGYVTRYSGGEAYWTRALHRRGTRWRRVRTPDGTDPGYGGFFLEDVAAGRAGSVWAAGYQDPALSGDDTPLIARYVC